MAAATIGCLALACAGASAVVVSRPDSVGGRHARPPIAGAHVGQAAPTNGWRPLEPIAGPALGALLADGTTVVLTAGGPDDSRLFAQRRTPAGLYGPRELLADTDAQDCKVERVEASGDLVAAAWRCLPVGQPEDPPQIAFEVVISPDAHFVAEYPDSHTASVDVSPNGTFAVFATDNQLFGTPEHILSFSFAGGAVEHDWAERGGFGDDVVAAVDNTGAVTMLRTTGFEDEPGYWAGGTIELWHFDDEADAWVLDRKLGKRGVGVTEADIDVAADGRLFAIMLRHHRSQEELWALRGPTPATAVLAQLSNRTPDIYAHTTSITRSGVALAAWQLHTPKDHVATLYATWAPGAPAPDKTPVDDGSVTSPAINAGRGVTLAVSPTGAYTLAWVRRAAGGQHGVVTAHIAATPGGAPVAHRWRLSADASVQASGGATGRSALFLGRAFRDYLRPSTALAYRRSAPAAQLTTR